jgi:hypothetical protein
MLLPRGTAAGESQLQRDAAGSYSRSDLHLRSAYTEASFMKQVSAVCAAAAMLSAWSNKPYGRNVQRSFTATISLSGTMLTS